ncbi:hypothetical protein SVAN01_02669 [Stagonosporopsis vannaccii]|nr:hypothetical protein SVAN01_02669 [Stagonosporopsis vannaccii]
MLHQRPQRASKTRAIEKTADMSEQPSLSSSPGGNDRLTLRFPNVIWNAHTPKPLNSTNRHISPPAGQKRKSATKSPRREDEPASTSPDRSSPAPRQCKVKVSRFQYGGPDARMGGQYTNLVTLEMPCLRSTCANCWRWHTHLMRGLLVAADDRHYSHGERVGNSPATTSPARRMEGAGGHARWEGHRNTATNVPVLPLASVSIRDFIGRAGRELLAEKRVSNAAAGLVSLEMEGEVMQT